MNLPGELCCNRFKYPILLFHNNQWGERGWVFNPTDGLYYEFEIDRKEQYDQVSRAITREAFLRDVRPQLAGPGGPQELAEWFDRYRWIRAEDGVWVHDARDDQVTRYAVGEMPRDGHGLPVHALEIMSVSEAADRAGLVAEKWLSSLSNTGNRPSPDVS